MAATILLIEDEERLAGYMQLWLEQVGYRCAWCSTGTAGLKKAAEWRPDLVILDLALPGMDGWEVCRRLRQESLVPIIMVTARGEEVDRVRGVKMGADDYVVKPFSLPELVARVEAVLRRAGSAEIALEWLSVEQRARVLISDAPLVEGAVLVATNAALGLSLEELATSAQEARQFPKDVGPVLSGRTKEPNG